MNTALATMNTHTKRLTRLATILRRVARSKGKKYRQWHWGFHRGAHKPAERNYCGTSACALGWASLDPRFRNEGLTSRWMRHPGRGWQLVPYFRKKRRGEYGSNVIPSAAEFFGLTPGEALKAFGGGDRSATVAANLMERLAKRRAEVKGVDLYPVSES